MKKFSSKAILTTRVIAYAAVSAALVYGATCLGFSSAQFYFNLGDAIILMVSSIFGPLIGMFAGGIGSFLADLTVYPATMVFTLIIKGLEGLISGLLVMAIRKFVKNKALNISLSCLSLAFSAYFMMTGYFICQTFFYGTMATALVALPMDAVQATCSFAIASIILFGCNVIKFRDKVYLVSENSKNGSTKQTEKVSKNANEDNLQDEKNIDKVDDNKE